MTVPTSRETSTVRGSSCREVLGRLKPIRSIRAWRPFATPTPRAMPMVDAAAPIMTASSSRLRITCRRVAPIALSSAVSRERWVTIIVNVFQMMKEPTNSATPAKIMNRIPTNLRSFLTASEFSLATVAPVTASVPSGTTARDVRGELLLAHALLGAHVDRVEEAGLAQQLLRGGGLEVRRRGAAEVLLATEADGADDGELLGRTLEEHLDRRAELDVVLLGAGGVDGDLVGAVRGFTRQSGPRRRGALRRQPCCSPCSGRRPG